MADRASEPSAIFWAVGIAASVALHASVVTGAALLAGRYAQASAPTEITFTDQTSPAVDPLKGKAERTQPSEVARTSEQERLAPASSAAASVKPETEALKPVATEVASKAETLPAETAAPAAEAVKPSQAAPAAAEALPSDRPETVAAAQPDTMAPAAAARTAPESEAEKPAAPVGSDTIAAAQDSDRLASSPAPDTASALPGETADRTIAEQQPAAVGSDSIAAAQDSDRLASSPAPDTASALPGETADRMVAEQQPAAADKAPVIVADQPKPETSAAAAAETAAPVASEPSQRVAALQQPASAGAAPATVADKPQPSAPAETVTALSSPVSGAETLTGGEPETLRPASPGAAGGTEVASTPPAGPETSQPLAPSGETVTGTAPETIVPSGSAGGSDGGSNTVAPSQSEIAQPAESQKEIALLVPARPNSVLGNEVDKPSDRYRRIVDFIRGYVGGDCFIALPAMDLDGDVTFQTFGRDKAREDDFRNALLGVDQLKTEISSGDVADPQCLALSFARTTKRYPGFSLVIDLHEAEMASGTKLSGSVLNAEGRDLHLLLVDDEGKVQSIDSFLSAGTGTDRAFSVPLTLTGGKPVATKQILIAITTDPPLPELATINEPADVFFRRLAEEIKVIDADVDLAVEGFNVR